MTDWHVTLPGSPEEMARPTTSTRDREDLRRRLIAWLGTRVSDPHIEALSAPGTNGMSSETLLFDAEWRTEGTGERVTRSCAARLPPDPTALPVFPVYDLDRQWRAMRLVAAHSTVPVPPTLWFEPDPEPLGSPFFVMERVDGVVPPDILPYTMVSWLLDASPDDQARLQRASVDVLARLHTMDTSFEEIAFLDIDRPGDTPLRRHVADQHAYYEWVAADGIRSPLIERTFVWLEENWPDETDTVVSWGDSRIGNILYRDFEPVAVLDWEMAALGPGELDVGWMIALHHFFQDLTEQMGMPGMPQFMRLADVASAYESTSGRAPHDLEWFVMYGALRHAIVMFRIGRRTVHFGEAEMPADTDDLVTHRAMLEGMLEGSYWSRI